MHGPSVATIRSGLGSLGHHLFDGGADHTVLQATTAAMRGADHASFRIGHEHRQAVGREHAERHVLLRRSPGRPLQPLPAHPSVSPSRCLRSPSRLPAPCAPDTSKPNGLVHDEQFVHIDGNAGMHLADQAQLRVDGMSESATRLASTWFRIIAGLASEIAVRDNRLRWCHQVAWCTRL